MCASLCNGLSSGTALFQPGVKRVLHVFAACTRASRFAGDAADIFGMQLRANIGKQSLVRFQFACLALHRRRALIPSQFLLTCRYRGTFLYVIGFLAQQRLHFRLHLQP